MKEPNRPIPAYDNWVECQTIQDLQAIRNNDNSLHMEALAIRCVVDFISCLSLFYTLGLASAVVLTLCMSDVY